MHDVHTCTRLILHVHVSLSSRVYQVEVLRMPLISMCDSALPTELPR